MCWSVILLQSRSYPRSAGSERSTWKTWTACLVPAHGVQAENEAVVFVHTCTVQCASSHWLDAATRVQPATTVILLYRGGRYQQHCLNPPHQIVLRSPISGAFQGQSMINNLALCFAAVLCFMMPLHVITFSSTPSTSLTILRTTEPQNRPCCRTIRGMFALHGHGLTAY
jgi:hypothetical protein